MSSLRAPKRRTYVRLALTIAGQEGVTCSQWCDLADACETPLPLVAYDADGNVVADDHQQ